MKTVVSITGIRPDFIRMASIFKLLDANFNHILVHTGQHYDELMSDIFFKDLNIRKPDFILKTGIPGKSREHWEQLSYLSSAIIELFREEKINPDLILFLGDSNSSCCALPLKKEGYLIGHIEAGMRSGDKRMLEEINRTVCDHCSDLFFVYHKNYKKKLELENIHENIYVVGNTIVEVCVPFLKEFSKEEKLINTILIDIHRPENFKYPERLTNIIEYIRFISNVFQWESLKMLNFPGTISRLTQEMKTDLEELKVEIIPLMGYKDYLKHLYNCKFIISDSGTAQEEPSLLNVPVIVPRDFTERPESVEYGCSFMIDVNTMCNDTWNESIFYIKDIENDVKFIDPTWLGTGHTAEYVIDGIKKFLN